LTIKARPVHRGPGLDHVRDAGTGPGAEVRRVFTARAPRFNGILTTPSRTRNGPTEQPPLRHRADTMSG
jgi:hypothetical protein